MTKKNKAAVMTLQELGNMCAQSMWQYKPFLLYKIADIVYEYYEQEALTAQQQQVAVLWYVGIMLRYAEATIEHTKFIRLRDIIANVLTPEIGVNLEEFIKACDALPENDVDMATYLLAKLGDLDKAPQAMIAGASVLVYQQDIANESETQGWRAILKATTLTD